MRDGGGGLRGAAGGRTSAWASQTCSRCPARWPRGCWAGSSLQGTEGRHGRGRDITGVGGTQEDMPPSSTQAGPGQTGWCWGLEARPPWLLFLWATPRDTSPREHLNPSFLAAPLQDTREPRPRPPGPSSACLHRSRREHTPAWSGAAVPEPPRWGPDGGAGPRTTWSPASSLTGPASLTQPSSALPCSQLAPQGLWDESSPRLGGAQHGRERPPGAGAHRAAGLDTRAGPECEERASAAVNDGELRGDIWAPSCQPAAPGRGTGPCPMGPSTLRMPLPTPTASATLELGNLLEPQLLGTGLGLQKTTVASRPTSDRRPGQVLEDARHPGPAHPLPTGLHPAHQAAPSLQTRPTGRPSSSRRLWGRAWGPGHRR